MILRFRVVVPKQGRQPDRFVWEIAKSAVLRLAARPGSARARGLGEIRPSAPPNTTLAAAPPRRRPTSPSPPPSPVRTPPPVHPTSEANPAAVADLAVVRLPRGNSRCESSVVVKCCR